MNFYKGQFKKRLSTQFFWHKIREEISNERNKLKPFKISIERYVLNGLLFFYANRTKQKLQNVYMYGLFLYIYNNKISANHGIVMYFLWTQ